jgi:F-box and WD-40 domain protein CDC4
VITSVALDSSYIVVGLANSKIQVFSAKTGVMVRTLVGHELGVWGVCLITRGGWMWGQGGRDGEGDDGNKGEDTGKGKGKKKEPDAKGAKPLERGANASMRGLRAGMAGLNVRDGLDHLLSPGMRYALGLDALDEASSNGSGGEETNNDEEEDEEEGKVFNEDEADEVDGFLHDERRGEPSRGNYQQDGQESHHHYRRQSGSGESYYTYDAASHHQPEAHAQETGYAQENAYEKAQETETPSNMCYSSIGWGQPSSIVVSGGCDKVLRVWDVESG